MCSKQRLELNYSQTRIVIMDIYTSDNSISNSFNALRNNGQPDHVNALLPEDEPRWKSSAGDAVTVTYSFMTAIPSYLNPVDGAFVTKLGDDGKDYTVNTFVEFNEAQKNAVKKILGDIEQSIVGMIGEIAKITFKEVSDANAGGQIRFGTGKVDDPDTTILGWARYPGENSGGDIWLNTTFDSNRSPIEGSLGFKTLLHEICHALGLKHPFEGSPTLPASEDNSKYTVMSYTGHPGTDGLPETPMLYDIEALRYLYGKNADSRTENNTYLRVESGRELKRFAMTIWDNGGIDTIDAEQYPASATINLAPGSFSSIGYKQTDNVSILKDTIIENAIGTALFADQITGNEVSNSLWGRGGGDTLNGEEGNDFLYGEKGDDTLNGGVGDDELYGGVDADTMFGGADSDYLDGWEGDDILYGGATSNPDETDTGNDVLVAWTGSDRLYGQDGDDWLDGSYDSDKLYGGAGNDILGNPASTEGGEPGDDEMYGGADNDKLYGGSGQDLLDGGLNSDEMYGGADNDMYIVDDAGDIVGELLGAGIDSVQASINYTLPDHIEHLRLLGTTYIGTGNALSNTVNGNTSENSLTGIEGDDQLYGKAGNDLLSGGTGNDLLAGEKGKDLLDGGTNDDSLVGGADSDILTGGAGRDKFIYDSKTEGVDTITDFSVIDDTIYIHKSGFGGGLVEGILKSSQFIVGATASRSSDRFLYDKSSGMVRFDIDGKGNNKAVDLAKLSSGLNMTYNDFYIVA
jgi:Ca2+-binding RTX toxin-like protein